MKETVKNETNAEIETIVYDKNAVMSLLKLIDKITISGISNIQTMFNITQLLNSPIKEDIITVDREIMEKVK